MEGNFASYIDRNIIPGRLYLVIHDPEGLVSTIPAIGTGLMGILTGQMLRNMPLTPSAKAMRMAIAGVISIAVALIWNMVFPINKNLWTSSFVLLAGGLSLLFLSLFYYIIDVLGHRKWAFFFRVIGMNSILIYMSSRFINWKYATDGFFMWFNQLVGEPWNAFTWVFCFLAVKWALLYFLYKKKVFLRV
jgi:predicted acyltransferase